MCIKSIVASLKLSNPSLGSMHTAPQRVILLTLLVAGEATVNGANQGFSSCCIVASELELEDSKFFRIRILTDILKGWGK